MFPVNLEITGLQTPDLPTRRQSLYSLVVVVVAIIVVEVVAIVVVVVVAIVVVVVVVVVVVIAIVVVVVAIVVLVVVLVVVTVTVVVVVVVVIVHRQGHGAGHLPPSCTSFDYRQRYTPTYLHSVPAWQVTQNKDFCQHRTEKLL
jgi:hypothetical protein